jgi:mono/diheme cytochrome c family protein
MQVCFALIDALVSSDRASRGHIAAQSLAPCQWLEIGGKDMCKIGQPWLAVTLLAMGVFVGCGNDTSRGTTVSGRWYTAEQLDRGRTLFQTQCASCHGEIAEGTSEWRETGADGHYPPPPLNGSAHAWHHPLSVLEQTIAVGGVPLGGVMPGFSDTLNDDEARSTIAYFQSFWPDEIYVRWQEIDAR